MKSKTKVLCGISFDRLAKWSVCNKLAAMIWQHQGRPKEPSRFEIQRVLQEQWMEQVYPGRMGPVKVEVVEAFVRHVVEWHGIAA